MTDNNVEIKKVTLKVLEIKETPNTEPAQPVDVDLAIGPIAGKVTTDQDQTVNIYLGEMTYYDPKKKKNKAVDLVQALFGSEGEVSDKGNVALNINLTGDNTFGPAPFITTVPADDESAPTRCMKVEGTEGSKQITVTFFEPAVGEYIAYPALYFNTKEGIIDPGMGVHRAPPLN